MKTSQLSLWRGTMLGTIVAMVILVSPALAQDRPDRRWIVRAEGMYVITTGDEAGQVTEMPVPIAEEDTLQDLSDGWGFGLFVEYMVTRKIGIEAGGINAVFDADVTLNTGMGQFLGTGDSGFTSLILGANYHLTPARRTDWAVGLYLHNTDYDEATYQLPGGGSAVWDQGEGNGYGLKVGVDVAFSEDSPWTFVSAIRHHRGPIDTKPVMISVGLGRKF